MAKINYDFLNAEQRLSGYYWVFIYDTWKIAHWSRYWSMPGKKEKYYDEDFDKIDEKIIKR